MLISFLRTILIYFIIIASLRFMGKRQIGELQPTELVVTLLISELASIPLEDADTPLFAAFVPVIILICLEVIISGINLKSSRFRQLFTGKPIIVIQNGTIDQKALKSLRISVADLQDTLRLKGYFDISKVKFAVVEMNGQISAMPKESDAPPTADELGMQLTDKPIPYTVINDGKLVRSHFKDAGTNEKKIQKQLRQQNLQIKDVLLMTCEKNGRYFTVKKDANI